MIKMYAVRHTYPERAGFRIYRKYGRDDFTFLHFHNSVEIVLNKTTIHTPPHAVILYAPSTPQYVFSKEPLIHDWFHFYGDLDDISFESFQTDHIYFPKNFAFISKMVAEIENEFFNCKNSSSVMMELLTKELFIKIDRSIQANESSITDPETEKMLRIIRGEVLSTPEKHWKVSDMASKAGISESRFFFLYKTVYGISPIQDLITARINSAKNILLVQNYSVEEISNQLGYENVTHFIRQFKTATGQTPHRYRQQRKVP